MACEENAAEQAADVLWRCPQCTFDNHDALPLCEVCGFKKPVAIRRDSGLDNLMGQWKCAFCTLLNDNESANCQVCQTSKPQGTGESLKAVNSLPSSIHSSSERLKNVISTEQWEDVLTKAKCGACINSFRKGDFTLMEEWVSLTEADLKEIGLAKGTIMRFKKHFHKDWTPPLSEAELAKQYGRKKAEEFSKKLREEYLPLFTDVKKILDDSQKGLNIEAQDLLKIDDKDLYNDMVHTKSALIEHGTMVEDFCADGIGKLEAALLKFQQNKFDKGLSIVQKWFVKAETSLTRHLEETTRLTKELQVTIDKVLQKVETSKEFVKNATRWNTSWNTGCKVVLGVSAVCLQQNKIEQHKEYQKKIDKYRMKNELKHNNDKFFKIYT